MDVTKPLHIVSWNVAGWQPTYELIKQWHGSLDTFLTKHNIDILCLQEVKVQRKKLEDTPHAFGALLDGYHTFFSCCQLPGQHQGLNGVATFARKGLTSSANSAVLDTKELDIEGRCMLTMHGDVALFNVYIPNDGPGSCRLPYKMKFLTRLRDVMQLYKKKGKYVILAGDLNISSSPEDVTWQRRIVPMSQLLSAPCEAVVQELSELKSKSIEAIDELIKQRLGLRLTACPLCGGLHHAEMEEDNALPCKGCGAEPHTGTLCSVDEFEELHYQAVCRTLKDLSSVQDILRTSWPIIVAAIESRFSEPLEVSHKGTGKQTKYRLFLPRSGGKKVFIGQTHTSEERAMGQLTLEPRYVTPCDDTSEDGGRLLIHHGNEMYVTDLIECLSKVCEVQLSPRQQIAVACMGQRLSSPVCGQWFDDIVNSNSETYDGNDGSDGALQLVDSFRTCHPHAQCRFTCWDQYKNRRYDNEGARIDYILVDQRLEGCISACSDCEIAQKPPNHNIGLLPRQRGFLVGSGKRKNLNSSVEALHACTAQGRWKPAPFDGSGMQEGTQEDYDAQFALPHTGIVYTPPTYSDHVGVSLLLKLQVDVELQQDAVTKLAQPYLSQVRISAFTAKRSGDPFEEFQRLQQQKKAKEASQEQKSEGKARTKSKTTTARKKPVAKRTTSGSLKSFLKPK